MRRNVATRRSVIVGTATVFAANLAGCISGDDNDEADERSLEQIAVDWGSGADNVDDENDIVDATDQESVRIRHGETSEGGLYISEPAIVRVDSGTALTYEWVSPGHSLTEVEGEGATITGWDDHDVAEGDGYEHTVTFDGPGVVLWECVPHRAQNHRGAVIVE